MAHDRLWAPWRLDYVKGPKDDTPADSTATESGGCFLCRYRDSDDDAGNHVLFRSERAFVVLNRFPYNNGHLLVAPLAHQAEPEELSDEALCDTVLLLRRMLPVLRAVLNRDGFNVGLNLGRTAGAGVPGHLHWHVVPRWNGDVNFMPVIADTKVIPQSLSTLYELLTEELRRA